MTATDPPHPEATHIYLSRIRSPGSTMASMLRWGVGTAAHQGFLRCQGALSQPAAFFSSLLMSDCSKSTTSTV